MLDVRLVGMFYYNTKWDRLNRFILLIKTELKCLQKHIIHFFSYIVADDNQNVHNIIQNQNFNF